MGTREIATEESGFSKRDSLALKGIAILMMMWHHCFLAGRFETYTINFWPLAQSQVSNIADFCKICVSLFVFVSGYGLYLTYQKAEKEHKEVGRWIYEKLVRTLSGYWFVLILAWIICAVLDNRPYRVYGFEKSVFLGIWNMFIEFLGLTNLVKGTQLNATWWYMSAAVVFIVLLPAIALGFKYLGCFCTLGIISLFPRISGGFPGWTHFYSFLPIFCIGMIFARGDFFGKWNEWWSEKKRHIKTLKFILMLGGLLIVYKLFYHLNITVWWDVKWNLLPLFVIFFAKDYLFQIPFINKLLIFIGKHATNIFLIHTFIRVYYCESFTYSRGHFILIMGTLLLASLGLSVVVESLKRLVGYDKWLNKLLFAISK